MTAPTTATGWVRFWARHVGLSATGAFAYACVSGWWRPQAVVGMLLGIGMFVAVYARAWHGGWFGWRFVITLLTGLLMSLGLVLLAGGFRGMEKLWVWWKPRLLATDAPRSVPI